MGGKILFLCFFFFFRVINGKHPGDHNHQDFPQSTAMQMGGVLQYKWEAYCDTNGRSTDNISLSLQPRGTKSIAIQIGGVLQYKWEVYCDTYLRSSGGWGFRHSSELRVYTTRPQVQKNKGGFPLWCFMLFFLPWNRRNGKILRPETITNIVRKQLFCVTDVRAIGKVIPRQLMCVMGTFTGSTLWRRPDYTRIPARKPCVTDALCNWEFIPK